MRTTPAANFELKGTIPPRRVPLTYKVALALSALAMVLLPLAYLGIIVAVALGVGYYAVHGKGLVEQAGINFVTILLYAGPLVAGTVLVVFMIKPLFAPRARQVKPCELQLKDEPALRRLILTVCAKVGAPIPSRVEVDCQVNASARLRRGLFSLGRDDLILTIGLPLAGGLDGRQFAGVLAHEFGHFTQGTGMAFSYLIRSINGWFARVVYERDDWDESLRSAANSVGTRMAIIVWLAIGAVALSRKVLHGLMSVGHAVSCLQLRQMEFDADYYAVHVAGSAAVAETSRELRRLAEAQETALRELAELWRQQRLVDDFPSLVIRRRNGQPTDSVVRLDALAATRKTRWSDTHPSDAARAAHARSLNLPGLFSGELAASGFFADFTRLSRTASQHIYREQFGLTIEPGTLVRTEEAAQTGDIKGVAHAALKRLGGEVLSLSRPLIWIPSDFQPLPSSPSAAAVAGALVALRETLAEKRESAQTAEVHFKLLAEDRFNVDIARAYLEADVPIKPASFNLISGSAEECARRRADLDTRLTAKAAELKPFEQSVHEWVCLVARSARDPGLAPSLPGDLARRLTAATDALAALEPWAGAFPHWFRQYQHLGAFATSLQRMPELLPLSRVTREMREKAGSTVEGLYGLVGRTPYPFPQPDGPITLADYVRTQVEAVDSNARLAVALQQIASIYFQTLGHCAALGEELERGLASSPACPVL